MFQSKTIIITLAIMVSILLVGAVATWVIHKRTLSSELSVSAAADALTTIDSGSPYTDLAGSAVNLDQYLGQILVVTSWASWAPASATELNLLAQAVDPFMTDGVVLIAINRAETRGLAEAYLRTIGVNEQVILILDPADQYYQKIAGYTMPETLFYDRQGTLVAHKRGHLTTAEVTQNIERALNRE